MTPEQYRIEAAKLAAQTEQYVFNSVSALPTLHEAAAVSAVLIAGVNLAATALADVFIGRMLRSFPLGIGRPDGDVTRIESALLEIAHDSPLDPLPRMTRLARSEPVDAGRLATVQASRERKVKQYKWQLDGESCDLCKYNAAHLWPISHAPKSHPSCQCLVIPVI